GLPVDELHRVSGLEWLYGVGDVTGEVLLTHQGKYQARAVGDLIVAIATGERVDRGEWGRHATTVDARAVPQVVFADPAVASVGPTASAAAEAGIVVDVVDYDLGTVTGASIGEDGYRGVARLVIDRDRSVIVGATFVGSDVAELLHAATIA